MTNELSNLTEIAEYLEARREELTARLRAVRADQSRTQEPLSLDCADRATQCENDDVVDSIGLSAESELARVEWALNRIEAGSFGRCVSCGSPIEAARLRAVPYAERCNHCAMTPASAM